MRQRKCARNRLGVLAGALLTALALLLGTGAVTAAAANAKAAVGASSTSQQRCSEDAKEIPTRSEFRGERQEMSPVRRAPVRRAATAWTWWPGQARPLHDPVPRHRPPHGDRPPEERRALLQVFRC